MNWRRGKTSVRIELNGIPLRERISDTFQVALNHRDIDQQLIASPDTTTVVGTALTFHVSAPWRMYFPFIPGHQCGVYHSKKKNKFNYINDASKKNGCSILSHKSITCQPFFVGSSKQFSTDFERGMMSRPPSLSPAQHATVVKLIEKVQEIGRDDLGWVDARGLVIVDIPGRDTGEQDKHGAIITESSIRIMEVPTAQWTSLAGHGIIHLDGPYAAIEGTGYDYYRYWRKPAALRYVIDRWYDIAEEKGVFGKLAIGGLGYVIGKIIELAMARLPF